MAAPNWISKGTASYHSKGTGASGPMTVAPTYPASPQADDIIWYHIHYNSESAGAIGDAALTTPPADFNYAASGLVKASLGQNTGWAWLYWKRALGTETGTVTAEITFAGTKTFPRMFAQMDIYRDCIATGNPYEDIQTTDETAGASGTATITFPALTLAGAERTLAGFVGQSDNIAAGTPGGYTERAVDSNAADIGLQLELVDLQNVSVDGAVTTTGGASRGWRTFHVALIPAAAAGGQPTMRRWGGIPGMQYTGRKSW